MYESVTKDRPAEKTLHPRDIPEGAPAQTSATQRSDEVARRVYNPEIKLAAVLSVTEDGMSYSAATQEHNIASVSTLKKWLIAYRKEGESALDPKPMGRPKDIHTPAPRRIPAVDEMLLRMENGRLAKKLGR